MKRSNSSLILVLVTLAAGALAAPAAADPTLPSSGGDEPAWSGDGKDLYVQSLGSSQPTPAATVEVADGGFQFGDAVIGALVASGLMLMALVVARPVARHRRQAAESRA